MARIRPRQTIDPRQAKRDLEESERRYQALVEQGVESAETLELLAEMGVDYAQGFHIGRPAPAEAGPGGG